MSTGFKVAVSADLRTCVMDDVCVNVIVHLVVTNGVTISVSVRLVCESESGYGFKCASKRGCEMLRLE